jgi:hypothetical protein
MPFDIQPCACIRLAVDAGGSAQADRSANPAAPRADS